MPPLRRFPAAVEQVRVWQQGPFIYIEWNAPSRNTDGSAEVELEGALILRRIVEIPPAPVEAEVPDATGEQELETGIAVSETPTEPEEEEKSQEPEEEAIPPPVDAEEPETADESGAQDESGVQAVGEEQPSQPVVPPFPAGAEELATLESTEANETLTFRDPWDPSWEGKRIEYGVRYVNRKGRQSGLSRVVHIDSLPPFAPPEDLKAQVEPGMVRLRWSSEEKLAVGEESAVSFGYNVYRRGETELLAARSLNVQPLLDPSYEDADVMFGQPWCYVVRRVAVSEEGGSSEAGPVIESVDSEEVCITPIDTFPPPVPENIVAVTSPEGVLLSWSAVASSDLKGYMVYRATDSEGSYESLTEEPVTAASFTDRSAESGAVYFYAVSAVDKAEPWNESPQSQPVSIRVP